MKTKINHTEFYGCGCGHPNAHPPCSYCTDTFECDLCGDIHYADSHTETKIGFLCEECYTDHLKIEEAIKEELKTKEKIKLREKRLELLFDFFAIVLIPFLVLLFFLIGLFTILRYILIHKVEECVWLNGEGCAEFKITYYLLIVVPVYRSFKHKHL